MERRGREVTRSGPSAAPSAGLRREALAGDIHAGIAQSATALILAGELIKAAPAEETRDHIERLQAVAASNAREVRRLLAYLRTPRDAGLSDALRQYADEAHSPDAAVDVELSLQEDPSGEVAERILWFAHRAVGVLRRQHAGGDIRITLEEIGEGIRVRLATRGAGIREGRLLEDVAVESGAEPVLIHSEGGVLTVEAILS